MFFKTDFTKGPEHYWGNHGLDMSNVYGRSKSDENLLRAFSGGRLKSQLLLGEEYSPFVLDANVTTAKPVWMPAAPDTWFAIGHEAFNMLPGLVFWSSLWLREHNRVSGLLALEHPGWDDERLFQTTKLVLLGELMRIVVEEYVQHLSGYRFQLLWECDILHDQIQHINRIHYEFNALYHWHQLIPDFYIVNGTRWETKDLIFNPNWIYQYGTREILHSFGRQVAGKIGLRNHGKILIPVLMKVLEEGRYMKLQSFNQYRQRIKMKPYRSFTELTGERELAAVLKELYGDVDAVELYVGLMAERSPPDAIFGMTMFELGSPFSLLGIFGNVLCSPRFYRPSTFGGRLGWDIVHTATLKRLICANIPGGLERCPHAGFRVPDHRPPVGLFDPGSKYGPPAALQSAISRFPTQLLAERVKLWELEPSAAQAVLQAHSLPSTMESARHALYGAYRSPSANQTQAAHPTTHSRTATANASHPQREATGNVDEKPGASNTQQAQVPLLSSKTQKTEL